MWTKRSLRLTGWISKCAGRNNADFFVQVVVQLMCFRGCVELRQAGGLGNRLSGTPGAPECFRLFSCSRMGFGLRGSCLWVSGQVELELQPVVVAAWRGCACNGTLLVERRYLYTVGTCLQDKGRRWQWQWQHSGGEDSAAFVPSCLVAAALRGSRV